MPTAPAASWAPPTAAKAALCVCTAAPTGTHCWCGASPRPDDALLPEVSALGGLRVNAGIVIPVTSSKLTRGVTLPTCGPEITVPFYTSIPHSCPIAVCLQSGRHAECPDSAKWLAVASPRASCLSPSTFRGISGHTFLSQRTCFRTLANPCEYSPSLSRAAAAGGCFVAAVGRVDAASWCTAAGFAGPADVHASALRVQSGPRG